MSFDYLGLSDLSNLSYLNIGYIEKLDNNTLLGLINLKNVELPDSLISIGENSFSNTCIEEIIIPESIEFIADNAFSGAPIKKLSIPFLSETNKSSERKLTDLGLDQNLLEEISITKIKDIPDECFQNFINLKNISLPSDYESIGNYAFNYCSYLSSLSLPDSLKEIGKYAFADTGITEMIIPESVGFIADNAFSGAQITKLVTPFIGKTIFSSGRKLTDLGLDQNILEELEISHLNDIPDECFQNFINLKTITIPEEYKSIGKYAFDGVPVQQISVSLNCLKIGDYAFNNCTDLKSLIIPDSVEEIGVNILANCEKIVILDVPFIGANKDDLTQYTSNYFGSSFYWLEELSIRGGKIIHSNAFYNKYNLKKLYIGADIEEVKHDAFAYCHSLEELSFSDDSKLKKIESSSFISCSKLKEVSFPDSLETIEYDAFAHCSNLQTININESSNLQYIGSYAFNNVPIKKFLIPSNIMYIENDAFVRCTSLFVVINKSSLTVEIGKTTNGRIALYALIVSEEDKDINMVTYDNCEYAVLDNKAYLSKVNKNSVQEFTLPSSIKGMVNGNEETIPIEAILSEAFRDTYIGSVVIPEEITNFREYAFANSGISKITIKGEVESIPSYCFSDNWTLSEISFSHPESITSIGSYAFCNTTIEEFTIPENVTRLEQGVFSSCSYLKKVNGMEHITYIDDYCFSYCSNLSEIILGENLEFLSTYSFYDCHTLYEVFNLSKFVLDQNNAYSGNVHYYAIRIYDSLDVERIQILEAEDCKWCINGEDLYLLSYENDGSVNRYTLPEEVNLDGKVFDKYTIYRNAIKNFVQYLEILGNVELSENIFNSAPYILKLGPNVKILGTYFNFNGRVLIVGDEDTNYSNVNFDWGSTPDAIYTTNSTIKNPNSYIRNFIPETVLYVEDWENGYYYCICDDDLIITSCFNVSNGLPESITYQEKEYTNIVLGRYSFTNYSEKELTIPQSIVWICPYALSSSSNLTKVIVDGDNLKGISSNVFEWDYSLSEIILNDSIEYIGESFDYIVNNSDCEGTIYIASTSNPYFILLKCYDNTKEYTINDDTEIIIKNSFSSSQVQKFIVGKNVRYIGYSAFPYAIEIHFTSDTPSFEHEGLITYNYVDIYVPRDKLNQYKDFFKNEFGWSSSNIMGE